MHELDADGAAIGCAQDTDDLAQGGRLQPQHIVDEDRPVEIGVREAEKMIVKLGRRRPLGETQRIEVGGQMAAGTIRAHQHQGARLKSVVARRSSSTETPEAGAFLAGTGALSSTAPITLAPFLPQGGPLSSARIERPSSPS